MFTFDYAKPSIRIVDCARKKKSSVVYNLPLLPHIFSISGFIGAIAILFTLVFAKNRSTKRPPFEKFVKRFSPISLTQVD